MTSGKVENIQSEKGKLHLFLESVGYKFAKDPWLIPVVILAIVYTIIFSAYSILKMLSLSASGWDLGLESQIMYTTLHGKLFYTNLLGFSLLQEHFSPFVFVILGVYSIHPGPAILLILQAIFVSFAAMPLYLFGKKLLEMKINKPSKWHKSLLLLVVLGYFLSPLTQGLIFFDFHIMSFLPFFYFLCDGLHLTQTATFLS